MDEAANRIREEVDAEANIIVGSTLDEGMDGMMRVSVVATGIDATEAVTEVPVPRRRLSEPLQPAEMVEEKFEAAYPADAAAAAEAQHVPVAAEARAEVAAAEPTLFEELDAQTAAAEEQVEHLFEGEADDGLPAPAYRPEPAAFQPQADAMEDAATQFVAPKPGTPTPEALARLQAAVERAPRPLPTRIDGPAMEPAAADKPRFGINSLIGRMTGQQGETQAPKAQKPRIQPPVQAADHATEADPEQERIEIPAFLRRQAN